MKEKLNQKMASDETDAATKRAENIIEQADFKELPSEDSPVVDGVVFDPVPAADKLNK